MFRNIKTVKHVKAQSFLVGGFYRISNHSPFIYLIYERSHHCVFLNVYKTCQRQPTALKLFRLIVYPKFRKICKFENHLIWNDVIIMSLPKTMEKQWENADLRRTKQNIHRSKGFDESYPKCTFYWIWATVSKVMGIYVKIYCDHSPNIVMSRDPSCKLWKFLFFA